MVSIDRFLIVFYLFLQQDEQCDPCQGGCIHPRPDGCTHFCNKSCHLSDCAVCTVNIKFECHCGVTPLYYKCGDFYQRNEIDPVAAAANRERMRSCGGRCTRNVSKTNRQDSK